MAAKLKAKVQPLDNRQDKRLKPYDLKSTPSKLKQLEEVLMATANERDYYHARYTEAKRRLDNMIRSTKKISAKTKSRLLDTSKPLLCEQCHDKAYPYQVWERKRAYY